MPPIATQPVKVDIRVIAATNRDLAEAVHSGMLRQDLYFRLNVVTLPIPPLAQRRGDIPLLAHYFLQKFAVQMKRPLSGIAPAVMETLQTYDYPGNVRELENIIARGCAVSSGDSIEPGHLPEDLRQQGGITLPGKGERFPTLEEQEKNLYPLGVERIRRQPDRCCCRARYQSQLAMAQAQDLSGGPVKPANTYCGF